MMVTINGGFGVIQDPKMPFLAKALEPERVHRVFTELLQVEKDQLQVRSIEVRRHKPARRCLIEYTLEGPTPVVLMAKFRARGLDETTYLLNQALWAAGFRDTSDDGVSIPEPMGCVPGLRMWCQRKVSGRSATELLSGPHGVSLCRKIAQAVHKLHRSEVLVTREHTVVDELNILRERLTDLAGRRSAWKQRLLRLLGACDELANSLPVTTDSVIHRDFYPDQVIVDGERIYLLDLDLCCKGDPALDAGNFIGHLIEQGLRTNNAGAFDAQASAFEEAFVALAGEVTRSAVESYTTLTLARHVYISTLFPERQQYSERILELCEARLGLEQLL